MKKIINILALLIVSLLAVSVVSAGTLLSGGKVDVKSNYQGFTNLSILATWSTTPATSDILYITDANLPDPYGLKQTIKITLPKGTFDQVFEVSNQIPLYFSSTLVDKRYWYFVAISNRDVWQDTCEQKVYADIPADKIILKGTDIVGAVTGVECHVQYVLVDKLVGYVGKPYFKSRYYKQEIDFDAIPQKLTLDTEADKYTDNIPNVAKATLSGFQDWSNAELTTDNIYAFHNKGVSGADPWKPYQDYSGLSTYNAALNRIISVMGVNTGYAIGGSALTNLQVAINEMNNEATRIVGVATTLPDSWGRVGDLQSIRYVGNEIIVPTKASETTKTALIQLLLNGKNFYLEIPTGKPKIISVDGKVTFDEVKGGVVNFKAQNIGSETGTFVARVDCSDTRIGSEIKNIDDLVAGATVTGTIALNSKSTTFAVQECRDCLFIFQEGNTKEQDTKPFNLCVIVKAKCAEGEESDPILTGTDYVVNVYTASCQIKEVKKCSTTGYHFEKVDTVYKCVANKEPCLIAGTCNVCTKDSNCGEGQVCDLSKGVCIDKQAQDTLVVVKLFIALIVALAVTIYLGYKLYPIMFVGGYDASERAQQLKMVLFVIILIIIFGIVTLLMSFLIKGVQTLWDMISELLK